MRLPRTFGLALGVLAWGACDHDQVSNVVTRDGGAVIPIISMSTASAGGFVGGSRATNRFLASGTFDTSFADAFGRATVDPPHFRPDPSCGFGTTPLIYAPGSVPTPSYTPPARYLPAIVSGVSATDFQGCGTAIAYIVPVGHPGNGAGNVVWNAWHNFAGAGPMGTRYVMGFVRYALEQRGALDITEILLTGSVTQADSLVFMPGDFNPGGNKVRDVFTTNCAAAVQPVAGANPHLLASDTSRADNTLHLDQTVCADAASVWGALGTAKSPVPTNDDQGIGSSQYNFYVVWEALADSTPDYSKPVYRLQIGPLVTTTGVVINNGYGPTPTGALSPAELALRPAATAAPDTIRVTANNLVPLASGSAYSVWLAVSGSGQAAKVTGRVIRRSGATVVDTVADVSEFNLATGMTGATVEFDFAPHLGTVWNAVTLAVGVPGATTLPVAQPLWTPMVTEKVPGGTIPLLTSTLTFGSFNGGGASSLVFAATGTGTGGIYGNLLREDILRLQRPPVGYMYEGWLVNSAGTTDPMPLGPLLSPFPDLDPLTDADVSTSPPLSGVELTQAALRFEGSSRALYCDWDQVQVRLAPKSYVAGAVPATIVLGGSYVLEEGACP